MCIMYDIWDELCIYIYFSREVFFFYVLQYRWIRLIHGTWVMWQSCAGNQLPDGIATSHNLYKWYVLNKFLNSQNEN